ncbi:MAG TPA: hypothetical protein DCL15_23315 [Chloroflexi bacterium]|nr:hypothetical protein [Chloroflexota bacterium]
MALYLGSHLFNQSLTSLDESANSQSFEMENRNYWAKLVETLFKSFAVLPVSKISLVCNIKFKSTLVKPLRLNLLPQ